MVGSEELDELTRILFVEGMHPEVPLERGRRCLGVAVWRLLVGVVELLEEVRNPAASVLYQGDAQLGESLEGAVADQGGGRVSDGPVVTLDDHREQAGLAE